MTWSISASGDRKSCIDTVIAQKHPADTDQIDAAMAPEVTQFEEARHAILDELEGFPESTPSISVSASGYAPGPAGGSRSLSISISGSVPVRS